MKLSQAWSGAALWLVLLSGAGRALAQDQQRQPARERLELFVSSSTEHSAFVEMGSDDGLEEGLRVTFYPPGGVALEGLVRFVSAHHARIEWLESDVLLSTGTPGEAWVLLRAPQAPAAAPSESASAEAPALAPVAAKLPSEDGAPHPWRSPPEAWNSERPLLGETALTAREDRPLTMHGRWSTTLGWRESRVFGRRTSRSLRNSADLRLGNVFGAGGQLRMSGELYGRRSTGSGFNESDTNLRLLRFSYEQPGDSDSPGRWILGRHVSRAMPEFGWLDGGEVAQRLSPQNELGISVGSVPQLGDPGAAGEAQAALFYRHLSDSRTPLDWRIGYQQTFKHGRQDRDLVVASARYRANSGLYASGTLWLDHYRSDDAAKPAGPEITRAYLSAGRSAVDATSWRVSYSESRFPLLLGEDFDSANLLDLYREQTRHVGLNFSAALNGSLNYHTSVDGWKTSGGRDESGFFVDGGLRLLDHLWDQGELEISVFSRQGEFSDTSGLLLDLTTRGPSSSWRLGYALDWIEDEPPLSGPETSWQNRLRAGIEKRLGKGWNLSLDAQAGWGGLGKTLRVRARISSHFGRALGVPGKARRRRVVDLLGG